MILQRWHARAMNKEVEDLSVSQRRQHVLHEPPEPGGQGYVGNRQHRSGIARRDAALLFGAKASSPPEHAAR